MSGFPTFKDSWPWPWIGSYCIPSCISQRPRPTYQISLKSKKRSVNGRTLVRTYVVRTDGQTFETGFIRSTLSKSRPKKVATEIAHNQTCSDHTKDSNVISLINRLPWFDLERDKWAAVLHDSDIHDTVARHSQNRHGHKPQETSDTVQVRLSQQMDEWCTRQHQYYQLSLQRQQPISQTSISKHFSIPCIDATSGHKVTNEKN